MLGLKVGEHVGRPTKRKGKEELEKKGEIPGIWP